MPRTDLPTDTLFDAPDGPEAQSEESEKCRPAPMSDPDEVRRQLRDLLRAAARDHARRIIADEEFDAEEVHSRQVLATYGLAMYYAQCLEVQISMMVAAYSPNFAQTPPDARDALFDAELKKTLGALARDLGKRKRLPETLLEELRKGVKLRNWLAHRYFWERQEELLSQKGREGMIAELEESAEFLRSVDKTFTDFTVNHDFDEETRARLKVELRKQGLSD